MFQKIDQDRLDRINDILKERTIKFPTATISKEIGVSESSVSVYLKGDKPMSDNYNHAFINRYGSIVKNEKEDQIELSSITPDELRKLKATISALKHHIALLMAPQAGCPVETSLSELDSTIAIYHSNLS